MTTPGSSQPAPYSAVHSLVVDFSHQNTKHVSSLVTLSHYGFIGTTKDALTMDVSI